MVERVPAGWLRGIGWRDADWTEPPSRAALDAIAPGTPVILTSKDYHSLWLNSAALAHAGGDLDAPGGVVERDAAGEPTGILRENAAWRFRDRHAAAGDGRDARRLPRRPAHRRGARRDRDPRQGRLARLARAVPAPARPRRADLRVWQSIPAEQLPHLRELGLRSGFGDDLLRAGYLKVFMDGTLGSATARLLDGSGVELTSSSRLAEIVREAAAAAGRSACTRSATPPTAPRWTRSRRPRATGAARAAPADRARPAARRRRAAALRGDRGGGLGPVHPRPLGPRPRRPRLGGPPRRLRLPVAARRRGAAGQRLRRAGRGARPARGSRPACCARSTSGRPGAPSRRSALRLR